jgi:heptaprenyl diphosphate synthase
MLQGTPQTTDGVEGLSAFFQGVQAPLLAVEREIHRALESDDPVVRSASTHLLNGGGKRLRPAVFLLAWMAARRRGASPQEPLPHQVPVIGAAIEVIHMATLVHDDLVDESGVRRGVPTVHAKWGSGMSILLGDYLFAIGFSLLSGQGDNRVVRIMSQVVSRMCAGEISQMSALWSAAAEPEHLGHLEAKTGFFIAESCRLGAVVAGAPAACEEALARYGGLVGLSYQITDDILDLTASPEVLGKPSGSDLRSGVITLPVIYALRNSGERDKLQGLLDSRDIGDAEVETVRGIVERCGGIAHAYSRAAGLARAARDALQAVPPSPALDSLIGLADYLVSRTF